MELCIKTGERTHQLLKTSDVSILVLMELCIKTEYLIWGKLFIKKVSILVLMELCIKTETVKVNDYGQIEFQSLF